MVRRLIQSSTGDAIFFPVKSGNQKIHTKKESLPQFQLIGDDSFFDYFLTFSGCTVIRRKFLTNSNDSNIINAPENTSETRPRINSGSTVISTTLRIIETKTNRDVCFKNMEITSPI